MLGPPSIDRLRVVGAPAGKSRAAAKRSPEHGLQCQRLMKRRDRETGILERSGASSTLVEDQDDRLQEPRARVSPAGRVKGQGQLRVPASIDVAESGDEALQILFLAEPGFHRLLHGCAETPTAMAKERFQELRSSSEVVIHPCVGHPHPRGHGTYLHGGDAPLPEQRLRGGKDLGARFLRATSTSRHGKSLP